MQKLQQRIGQNLLQFEVWLPPETSKSHGQTLRIGISADPVIGGLLLPVEIPVH